MQSLGKAYASGLGVHLEQRFATPFYIKVDCSSMTIQSSKSPPSYRKGNCLAAFLSFRNSYLASPNPFHFEAVFSNFALCGDGDAKQSPAVSYSLVISRLHSQLCFLNHTSLCVLTPALSSSVKSNETTRGIWDEGLVFRTVMWRLIWLETLRTPKYYAKGDSLGWRHGLSGTAPVLQG